MDKVNHLEEAEGWIVAYKSRLHDEPDYSADAAYKMAKLHIEFAQTQELRRIADALAPAEDRQGREAINRVWDEVYGANRR